MLAAPQSVRYIGPQPEPDADELLALVVAEIDAMRREDDAGRP